MSTTERASPRPTPITLAALRPHPVSGHVQRVKRQSGDRWRVKWRDAAGVEHLRVLGRVWTGKGRPAEGYLTKQEAQRQLDEILVQARRVGPGARRAVGRGVSFEEAAREWLRYVQHDRRRRATTMVDYRHVVESALIPAFGELPLTELTSEMIDAFRVALVHEGRLSPRTINKYLVLLNGIMKRAQRHWGLTVNPAAGVERQPVRRSGDFRVLTAEQVTELVDTVRAGRHHGEAQRQLTAVEIAARAEQDRQDAALLTTAAFAGLRLGELRGLRWGDVDVAKCLIHVRRAYTMGTEDAPKSGRVRAVPMIDPVAEALQDLAARQRLTGEEDLVFGTPEGGYLEDSALRRRYYAALKAAGIRHLRFHDLRHTFGTLAVQVFPLSDVQAYMGHADIATTMIYVHHVPRNDDAAKLTAALAAAADTAG